MVRVGGRRAAGNGQRGKTREDDDEAERQWRVERARVVADAVDSVKKKRWKGGTHGGRVYGQGGSGATNGGAEGGGRPPGSGQKEEEEH